MCTFTLIAGWFRKLMGFGSGRNSQYSSNETSCESISTAMIDLIVAEVKAVYTVLAKRDLEIHRSQISLQSGGADYFWLVDKENLDQKLPEAKATELENLCYTLKVSVDFDGVQVVQVNSV